MVQVEECYKRTDRRYQVHYLPPSLSYDVDNNINLLFPPMSMAEDIKSALCVCDHVCSSVSALTAKMCGVWIKIGP